MSQNNIPETVVSKVLVYMLDGARADALAAIKSPIWEKLCSNQWKDDYKSMYTMQAFTAIDVEPSSAANHVSIATGLNGIKHKIERNELFKEYDPERSPSFLEIFGRMKPASRSAFLFGWADDCNLIPRSGNCTAMSLGSEKANCQMLCNNLLVKEPTPDLIFFHDDEPDHGGHQHGFYPVSDGYKDALSRAMERFTRILDTISARETFPQEDWLIILCSDHGGCGRIHGTVGGHSSTVPLLLAGKHFNAGYLDGIINVVDIAPMVLAHFNWHDLADSLDGKSNLHTLPEKEDIALKLDYSRSKCSKTDIELEKLVESGEFTLLAELDTEDFSDTDSRDILGNRSSSSNTEHGFCLYVQSNQLHLNIGCQDAELTFQIREHNRIDLGPMHCAGTEKVIIGIALNSDKTITFYHQNTGEDLCWICEHSSGIRMFNARNLQIFSSAASKVRIWNKAVTPEDFSRKVQELQSE